MAPVNHGCLHVSGGVRELPPGARTGTLHFTGVRAEGARLSRVRCDVDGGSSYQSVSLRT